MLICHWKVPKHRVQIHIKQHAVCMYCECRYNKVSREAKYNHQAARIRAVETNHGPRPGHIYQVDHPSYHAWAKMGWDDLSRFPDCHPTLRGDDPEPETPREGPSRRILRKRQKKLERRAAAANAFRHTPATTVPTTTLVTSVMTLHPSRSCTTI